MEELKLLIESVIKELENETDLFLTGYVSGMEEVLRQMQRIENENIRNKK